ncbi:MAG: glycosyltransferase [Candidatus Aegiribacteria sp.]|nr:glycosyltransferase [Candidatus Aegiribacteria sp.]
MRICDVNSLYSETGGGIRVYHDRKLDYFSEHPRHTAALVIPGKDDSLAFRGSSRIYSLRSIPLFKSGYRMIVDSGGLNSAFLDFRPDIIEIGSPYLLPALTVRAMGDSRVPTVGFYHSDFPDSYVRPYAGRIFPPKIAEGLHRIARSHVSRYYSRMTAVFAASECMLEKLYEAGVRRLFHTPLGVNTDRFSPSVFSRRFRNEVGASDRSILVLYLARLHWEKGLDLLMKAYPIFRDPGRIKLVIGGRGPHEGLVNDFIEKYPEVHRLPFMRSRDSVAEAMASADVFLSLGRYETFGLAGLEAVASGTIPVLPDAEASGEIAASLGLLSPFEPGNPESLAASVSRAAEKSCRETTECLRKYAVEGHSWADVFRRMESFYESIMEACEEKDIERLVPKDRWWK